ncbi:MULTISPECIES: hypothetical protein [unclassified Nodularia (in: cyanobacteria)]|uniref:hypothetical protein n=1 Tax=unclassified Nodularia (in: cyanobacteria) TaxID=2656917 RepID=UPI0018813C5A|nr:MULTISPECIES: hypothetical protein [unclassified Nodularia (in: cyanobacteria)]MBE9201737.1 hypothetical protein [Nodularia sp. LEGE 06071]MCC2691234.1 hypothetical protein [Nodularia sp. LEGE 04288]
MSITSLIPTITLFLFLLFALYVTFRDNNVHIKNLWIFPAFLSVLFLTFSVYAVASGGLLGFWTEHIRNFWGNQIWLDLLLSIGIGWSFVVPQAKALGMRPLPWLFLVVTTGSIGFMAMIARLLYLQEKAETVEN